MPDLERLACVAYMGGPKGPGDDGSPFATAKGLKLVKESRILTEAQHIVCPACAAVNRVPAGRAAGVGRCGRCGGGLFAGKPVEADAAMFERQTTRSGVPVLVDVWAPWCGPCRTMAPAFEAAAATLEPEMRLLKLNSDAEPGIAGRLGIRGIPTMLLYAGGREIARTSGAMSSGQIVSWARSELARSAGGAGS